jgi:MFS family permease
MKNGSLRLLPQLAIALTAYGGAFIFGILLGWSSPAAPKLLSEDNDFEVSRNQFAWIVSTMALGATIATAVSGVLRNKFGTKSTVVMIGFPTTAGWLLIIFAKNSEMVRK